MGHQKNWRAVVVTTVLCFLSSHVEAWPTGAPTSVCSSLMPGHGAADNTLAYTISIDPNTDYNSSTPIQVTVNGGVYQGILLQARDCSGTPVGTFSNLPANTKLIACTTAESTVTHSSTAAKNGVSYTWNPPSTHAGDVYFVATVAQAKATWRMDIRSSTLGSSGCNTGPSFLPEPIVIVLLAFAALLRELLWWFE